MTRKRPTGLPRGTSPKYTPTRHEWLRKLQAKPGMVYANPGPLALACRTLGWTEFTGHKAGGERLTPAGLAKLEEWNVTGGKLRNIPGPKPGHQLYLHREGARPGELERLADWLVATDQVIALAKLLTGRAPAYHTGGPVGLKDGEVATVLTKGGPEFILPDKGPTCCDTTPGGEVCDGDHPPRALSGIVL